MLKSDFKKQQPNIRWLPDSFWCFIGKNSLIRGDVQCNSIEVNGKIYGNIKANGKVVINSGAEVYGDISASDLCVQNSAVIVGKVKYIFNRL